MFCLQYCVWTVLLSDGLSRLPMFKETNVDHPNSFIVLENVPLSFADIAKSTQNNVVLSKILDLIHKGK